MESEERLFLVTGETHRRAINRMFNFGDNIPVPVPHHALVVAVSVSDAIEQEIERIGARGRAWDARVEELQQKVEAGELAFHEAIRKIDPLGLGPVFLSPTQVFEADKWDAQEVSLEEYDIILRKKVTADA